MSTYTPFMPKKGGNQKVSATTTSAAITIGKGNKSLRVINAGANVTYFRTFNLANDGAQAATNADTPMAVSGAAGSVTATTGALTVAATDSATIRSRAASVALAAGFGVGGLAVSGAGVLGHANAQAQARTGHLTGRRKLGQLEVSSIGLGVQNMSRTYQTTLRR